MTPDEIREHATGLILDHARDVEWLSIHESLEDFDLTADEADRVAKQIDEFIAKATITVELPGGEG
jgi:hypothetical protein